MDNDDLYTKINLLEQEKQLKDELATARKEIAEFEKKEGEKTGYHLMVEIFSGEMVEKLLKNSHKGGWDSCTPAYLSRRLGNELKELREIMHDSYKTPETKNEIIRECADIANFAMMIAQNVGGLLTQPPTPTNDKSKGE